MTPMYFDIESIPSQIDGIRDELAKAIEPPGNISKADTVAAWHAEKKPALVEDAYLKTSFDGGVGQAVVIGFAVGDGPAHAYSVTDLSRDAERKMIKAFFCAVTDAGAVQFIGHNVIAFDFPFLWKRAMVLGVKPPWSFPRNPKPWGETVADTMLIWDATQRAGGSMDRVCRLLGIPGKGDMDGSKVWPYVQAGRMSEVADYCKADVERTRAMHRRMMFADAQVPMDIRIIEPTELTGATR